MMDNQTKRQKKNTKNRYKTLKKPHRENEKRINETVFE
jgi:hypothetical protein